MPLRLSRKQSCQGAAQRLRPRFDGRDHLSWLFLSRLLLVLVLLLALSFADTTSWLPQVADRWSAHRLLLLQATLILLSGLMIIAGWPRRDQQAQLAVYLDIAFAIFLIHLSGGIAAGFGLLPAVAVIWGAILLEGRQSLLFAALASLGVISQQLYADLYLETSEGSYFEAGLLGLVFFSVAALAHLLSQRLHATEKLAARRQLDIADLSKLNESVIQQLSTGVLVIDGERRIRLLNAAAQRMLHDVRARPGVELKRVAPRLFNWFERSLAGETVYGLSLRLWQRDLRPSLQLLGVNRPHGALIYLQDEQELLRQAQEVNLASLGRLSASIAHNIRNPLSAVTHASQLLAESPHLGAEDQTLLEIIRRNADRLDEIVNSVLELSHRHRAELRRILLNHWLAQACDEYREQHQLSDQALTFALPEVDCWVKADPRHLRQILNNLCDNAREHGKDREGHCRMHWSLEQDADAKTVVMRLCDQGPGVPSEQRQTIFEPFFTTAASGNGLGLFAAQALAEAIGVRLEYSDRPQGGSCFSLIFER
ncbi:MAG: ATP-binding protein [Lamprobacter sp.]|uniref:sensor histidine kinase n=1 Tax=Lamprobacter sp. TaxID=3100796 RepID=UPI002B261DEE|nr:ATP-binding protein [Lamprobacter sp.]MEA3639990.1 ATP-binding protein [Lamprobacter sp.]